MSIHILLFELYEVCIARSNESWAGEALETVNCCAFLKRRLIGAC
jgi:hypothetical protein